MNGPYSRLVVNKLYSKANIYGPYVVATFSFCCINKTRIAIQTHGLFKEIALTVIPPRHMKLLMEMRS
ncbi:hypothetical protein L1887_33341 [Cichorium endivia]|nr:hypothetical protein L1887_33341 [Cichorium endivia]